MSGFAKKHIFVSLKISRNKKYQKE